MTLSVRDARWCRLCLAGPLVVAMLSTTARPATAGQDPVTPPPNILVPNSGGVPSSQTASLEGGAFVARANDSSANWFNPAGLARASVSSVSATGGALQFTRVTMAPFPESVGSFRRFPAVVGAVFKPKGPASRWTYGFSILQFNSWSGSVATELLVPRGAGHERFGYTAASRLSRRQGSVGAAHDSTSWRYGVSLAGELTNFEKDQTASDLVVGQTGALVLLGSSRFTGTAVHLRVTAGVQRDLSKTWKIGATIRSPGMAVYTSGVAAIDGASAASPVSATAYLSAPDARFRYQVPLQGVIGVAWVGPRFEAELAVRGSAGHAAYDLLSSDVPLTVVTDDGHGGSPVTQTTPWTGVTSTPRGYVDAAIGGHATLSENGIWKLHFGYATNAAPVTEADEAFNAIALHTATLGLGGELKHVQSSVGLRYEFGTSSDFLVRSLAGGPGLVTSFKVRNIGVLYSVAYKF